MSSFTRSFSDLMAFLCTEEDHIHDNGDSNKDRSNEKPTVIHRVVLFPNIVILRPSSNHQHRTPRMVDDAMRNTSQKKPAHPGSRVGTHNDYIAFTGRGFLGNGGGGRP